MTANREAPGEFGSKEVIARYSMKHIHDSMEEFKGSADSGRAMAKVYEQQLHM
jgi:hypothetical protein